MSKVKKEKFLKIEPALDTDGSVISKIGETKIKICDDHDFDRKTSFAQMAGGSNSSKWNKMILNQAIQAIWETGLDEQTLKDRRQAVLSALASINPQNEIEAMIAVQLISAHNASMECYRRAMLPNQTTKIRNQHLHYAQKLSKTWTDLLQTMFKGQKMQRNKLKLITDFSNDQK